MIIRLPLRFEGSKSSCMLYALFDSGATYSCMGEQHAAALESITPLHKPMRLATASNNAVIEIRSRITLDFYHDDIRLSDEFLVVPELSEEVIIGAHTMQKWRLKLDFEHDTVLVDPRVSKLILINLIAEP